MSTSRARSVLGLLAVVPLAWITSFPAAEFGFRALGDRPPADLLGLYQAFGDGSYRHASMVDTDANWQSGHFSVYTDGLGLRCDRLRRNAAKAGDEIDVLVLGDSQGYGQGADYENTLVGSLANQAAARGMRIRNASVGGQFLANQRGILEWLRDEQHVRPRSLLVLATPRLIANAGRAAVVRVGEDGRLYSATASPGVREKATLWVKTHLVLYARFRDAMRAVGLAGDSDGATSPVRLYRTGEHEDASRAKLLDEAKALLAGHGSQRAGVYFVYAPLAIEENFDAIRQLAAKDGVPVDPDAPYRTVSAVAASLRIPLLDLRPVLKRIKAAGEELTLRGDPHYSGPLSQASASAILEWLVADGGRAVSDQETRQ